MQGWGKELVDQYEAVFKSIKADPIDSNCKVAEPD